MAILLSGSKLRSGGSGEFLPLSNAQPQLPASASTTTGFTLITNDLLQTRYTSSLGNIEFNQSRMYSNQSTGTITILATGTVSVSTSTATGPLVVTGGVGIGRNLWVKEDIHVNNLTIGRGYEGKNNIVIVGDAETSSTGVGQENLAIGYDTLTRIDTAYRSIAIGSHVFKTGTNIANSIAIGNKNMENLGVVHSVFVNDITDATQANPVVIEVVGHNLSTGSHIVINDVAGMSQLNGNEYYVNADDANHLSLYTDIILSTTVDGTAYTTYSNGGTLSRVVYSTNNIAVGNDVAPNLIDGEHNFFIGNRTARDLTTGSYNFFLGTDVGNNITQGNGIISIGAETIVDGVDDQIGIGSVFYYNGTGTSEIYSTLSVGLGDDALSTTTGALRVIGGVGVDGSVYSRDGHPDENYLLYTPRVFVSDLTPNNPRIGDFWIDKSNFAYMQFINDDGNHIWLQVSTI